MPRIRKRTSNRVSTNDRAKVRHKVKESRKKKAKAAKKNPQWKSRKPKDPGIPNEFPYKDRILAEVAEQRRNAIAEKLELKTRPRPNSEQDKNTEEVEVEQEEVEEEEEVPVLINRDLPTLQSVLEKADVVLEVVDARDPLSFRSEYVERLVRDAGKDMLLVLNKIDTCPREALTAWAGQLRMQCPTLMFRSATAFLPERPTMHDPLHKKVKGKGKSKIDDALGAESILNCFSRWAKEKKKAEKALIVAVVGLASVGKSSLINSLLKRAALPIYSLASSSKGPSTTEVAQEVTLEVDSQKIVLIDTPGLSFVSDEDIDESSLEEFRVRDILLRSKGRIDRLRDPRPPIAHIVSRANAEDLMLLYSLPAFTKGDSTAFLSGVARANQLVKRKGELDLTGAARVVLRDWNSSKIARYTTPTVNDSAVQSSISADLPQPDGNIIQLYVNDEDILSVIQTRKEKRKQDGLVRFACGSIDPRKVAAEEPWNSLERNVDEESDEDEVDTDVDSEEEEDEEEEGESGAETEDSQEGEEDVEDEEESEIQLTRPSKRKRGPETFLALPPVKRVAFSARRSTSDHSKIEAATKGKKEMMESAQQKKKSLKPVLVSNKAVISKPKGKTANIAVKTKRSNAKDKSESEAYDFGKFF